MKNIENIQSRKILISPLDWGIGHTTRCIPLIHQLLEQNNQIFFAGNDFQNQLISKEFPLIETFDLEGYNIKLSSKKSTYTQVLNQVFTFKKVIKQEKKWLLDFVKKKSIDLILSDNRYGFYHTEIESIFITHQLNLQIPKFQKIVNGKLLKYIHHFNSIWIPDDEKINLSGNLSVQKKLKISAIKIGLLSRFKAIDLEKKYHYLFIVSGPAPENATFLSEIIEKINSFNEKVAIISPVKLNHHLNNHIDFYLLPETKEMEKIINQSIVVVAKSGYTSLMELVKLKKRSVLIPTKGQFEQEYLAKHFKSDEIIFINSLEEFYPKKEF